MRLFVAISLPAALRARLAGLQSGLPGARWVAPDNLHLTLRFIGEVDGLAAHDIDAALSEIRAPRFALTFAGVDRFGGSRTRSIWVGVEENDALAALRVKVEHAVRRAGQAPVGGKYKPHVTLARFKANPGARLHAYLARHALFRAAPIPVEEFVLYSSTLARGGATYTQQAAYALSGAAR